MKLSKERIKAFYETLKMVSPFSNKALSDLFGHIEALEQELTAKPKFVALNYDLTVYEGDIGKLEPKGFIFEVAERNEKQWNVVSGKYKDKRIHKSHVSEIDINEAMTGLRQENLQRLEEVKFLQRKVNSLDEYAKKKAEQNRTLRHDSDLLYGDYKKMKAENELMAATLERAMLDQQSVVLPKEVVEAIDYLRSIGIDNDEILRLSFTTYRMSHCAHRSALGNYAIDYPNKVASALVNSYTLELTLPIVEELADMIQEWTNEPTFDDEDAACLKLATAIAERTKEFYSK